MIDLKSAEEYVLTHDRLKYKDFFTAAEIFCTANGMIIGGQVGIDLLCEKPLTKDSWFWELYTDNVFETAKKFADNLAAVDNPLSKTVALQTNIKYTEYTVMINANFMFKIYALSKYRGVELISVMNPIKLTGYFGNPINVIPEEIQLINIYKNLYNPMKAPWTAEINSEAILFSRMEKKFAGGEIVGGADLKEQKYTVVKLLKNEDFIILGDYAIYYFCKMMKCKFDTEPRLQLITEKPLDEIVALVEKKSNVKIIYNNFNLNVPSEFQLKKFTIYVSKDDKQMPVADIFNSTSYELVPFMRRKKIRIANPFVVLKFIFIDIWIVKLIMNINPEKDENSIRRIKSLLNGAKAIRDLYQQMGPDMLFLTKNHAGVYINEAIAKKKLIKDKGERFKTYYPLL